MAVDCDVSIVIVSWNVRDYLRRCLNSLKVGIDQSLSYEIIVVDNDSTDNTVSILKQEFPKVKLIQNKENAGFARANNQGISISRGECILLLNPDAEVTRGSISKLISFLRDHDQVGVAGPKLLNLDGTLQPSGLNFPSLIDSLLGYFRLKQEVTGAYFLDAAEPISVNALVGACLLVRRDVINQVGGFDEDYFMYVEEADWCYRIGNAGWLIYYMPDATVYHWGGQSAVHVPATMYVALRKSRLLFLLKHRSRFEAISLSIGYMLNAVTKSLFADGRRKETFRQAASEFSSMTLALLAGHSIL